MKATFGAGCFWHVEALFRRADGVSDVCVGYTGGNIENPTYEQVCMDRTGHAEAVQVEYDPRQTSYEKLLRIFWEGHDPTTLNRQGPDVGTQYRSAIFVHDEDQRKAALESKKRLEQSGRNITTEVSEAPAFYKAEEYHQKYYEKNGLV